MTVSPYEQQFENCDVTDSEGVADPALTFNKKNAPRLPASQCIDRHCGQTSSSPLPGRPWRIARSMLCLLKSQERTLCAARSREPIKPPSVRHQETAHGGHVWIGAQAVTSRHWSVPLLPRTARPSSHRSLTERDALWFAHALREQSFTPFFRGPSQVVLGVSVFQSGTRRLFAGRLAGTSCMRAAAA